MTRPYAPYRDEAFLAADKSGYSLTFRGIAYKKTSSETALGTLLFGLRPAGINFKSDHDIAVSMQLMEHAAYILHLHATGSRYTLDGQRRVPLADLNCWVSDVVALARDAGAAEWSRGCINEALGPNAYLD